MSSNENDGPGATTSSKVEDRIIAFSKLKISGFTDKDLQAEMPDVVTMERAKAINVLLSKGFFDLFKKDGQLFYKYKDPSQNTLMKGTDNEEKVVYRIIEEAGNKGIWIRDIRFKSNLMMMQLNKILKSLENKKLIKAVKSVAASKKKVYMLFKLEPDSSITGGAWYQGQEFESEFVDLLNQQCYRYLLQKKQDSQNSSGGPLVVRNKSYVSLNEVHKYIADSGISNVALTVEDIGMIMNIIVLDGRAENKIATDGTKMFRAIENLLPVPSFVQSPCGICPVINRCSNTGLVNPKACEYFNEWLNG